jgi:hypothetical protein
MAIDATLTKLQKNAVLSWVLDEKCDPTEFEWKEIQGQEHTQFSHNTYRASELIHFPTGFYVRFGAVYLTICPGPKSKVEEINLYQDWNARERTVRDWLERVKAEHEAPDLWAMAFQDRAFLRLSSVFESANTNFTSEEQQYIAARLDAIRDFVIGSGGLESGQQRLIEAQIQYAKEATKRLGRVDWKGVLINTLFAIAVNAVFTPDRTRQLFQWRRMRSCRSIGQHLAYFPKSESTEPTAAKRGC